VCAVLKCVTCLSEPGYTEFLFEFVHKYGTIVRMWIGPYLGVFLIEAKYVEVSKLLLAI
jgi:hypothetical protein